MYVYIYIYICCSCIHIGAARVPRRLGDCPSRAASGAVQKKIPKKC